MANQRKKLTIKKPKTEASFLKRDISVIVIAAFCVFIAVSMWVNMGGGMAGEGIKWLLVGLFGDCAYSLPVFIAFGIVFYIKNRNNEKLRLKLWLILTIPFWLSAVMHYTYSTGNNPTIKNGLVGLFESGIMHTGGVFGGLIGEPIIKLTGNTGAFLILSIIILVIAMIVLEVSVLRILKKMLNKIREFFASLGDALKHDDIVEIIKAEEPKKLLQPKKIEKEPLKPYNWAEDDIVISGNVIGIAPVEEPKPSIIEEIFNKDSLDAPKANFVEEGNQIKLDENQDAPLPIAPEEQIKKFEYIFPTSDLLEAGSSAVGGKVEVLKANAQKLIDILASFGIEAKVTNITRGSSVTRYEILPALGVKVNKVTSLDLDIALRLPASNVRIEVMPGSIGIEVSNEDVSSVYLRGLLDSDEFITHTSKLAVALGKDIEGKPVVLDIAKTPHMLIAGATGSGKSVCINTIITSILFKASPEEVRLVMVDPKVVELGMYNGIPHLLVPIVTDPRKAAGALCWAVQEMENRYKLFSENSARDLAGYNRKCLEQENPTLPQIVIIIDELADLMMVAPSDVQDYICRLAQKARAAGMHLVLATQRPSVDVITGLIKANIPTRISFSVSSQIDSRTILDQGGAEKLLGKGDMLLMLQGTSKLRRVQGAFVSDKDVEALTSFVKQFSNSEYSEDAIGKIDSSSPEAPHSGNGEESYDSMLDSAADVAFELGQISASMIQRRLSVGYARAGRLIDLLDKKKIISSYDGSNKPRQVIMSRGDYLEMKNRD